MLEVISFETALKVLKDTFQNKRRILERRVEDAAGFVVGEDVVSPISLPPFDRATMDGYALCAQDVVGISESFPAMLKCVGCVAMGEVPDFGIQPGQCAKIPTGGCLPKGADCVAMVEHSETLMDDTVLIYKSLSIYENVLRQGQDIRRGDVVVKRDTPLTPVAMGALSGVGLNTVKVFDALTVGLISTGNEIIPPGQELYPGKVYEVNASAIGAKLTSCGFPSKYFGIIRDEFELLRKTMEQALEQCDVVILSGGSSVGTLDYTLRVIDSLSGKLMVNGLAIKPGKPTICADVGGKPVFGLPGHPVSAYMIFCIVVLPLLCQLSGRQGEVKTTTAVLNQNYAANAGRDEFVPVSLGSDGSAQPVRVKSGMFATLLNAHGYIRIPRNTEGLRRGERVDVTLF